MREEDLSRLVARHAPGSQATIGVVRGGKTETVQATLDVLTDTAARAGRPANEGPQGGERLRSVAGHSAKNAEKARRPREERGERGGPLDRGSRDQEPGGQRPQGRRNRSGDQRPDGD